MEPHSETENLNPLIPQSDPPDPETRAWDPKPETLSSSLHCRSSHCTSFVRNSEMLKQESIYSDKLYQAVGFSPLILGYFVLEMGCSL